MKSKLCYIFLLVALFLVSCERTNNVTEPKIIGSAVGSRIIEYTIDGHDYIEKGYGMSHSGTCKKCKQERDSIVNVLINEIRNGKK